MKRRRLEAADAREAILAAAESLLVENGADALRLTEVAFRAGISHPNVLYHFGTVAELQAQLGRRVAARMADDLRAVMKRAADGTIGIERTIGEVFRLFDARGYARLLVWLEATQQGSAFDGLAAHVEMLRAALAARLGAESDEKSELRRRVVPVMQLVMLAAIGYGLSGRRVEALFGTQQLRPSVARVLGELLAGARDAVVSS